MTASVPQIESVTSQINKYVSFDEIQNLPLQNRDFLDVLKIVPGVSSGVPAGTYADRGPRNSFNIHGGRSNDNDFLLDGAANNDKSDLNYEDIASTQILGGPTSSSGAGRAGQTFQVGTALQTYNLDAIQEVQVSTSMFSAEYGSGGSGGVINVITRSGTNLLAGSVTVQEQRDAWVKGSDKQARSVTRVRSRSAARSSRTRHTTSRLTSATTRSSVSTSASPATSCPTTCATPTRT